MRKVVSKQVLDSVLEHVTDHQDYEERPCDVSIFHLGMPCDCRSEYHCDSRRYAVIYLFHGHTVLLLVQTDVEFAFDELLEHAPVIDQLTVMPVVHVQYPIFPGHLVFTFLHYEVHESFSCLPVSFRGFHGVDLPDETYGPHFDYMAHELVAETEITASLVGNRRNVDYTVQCTELGKHQFRT